MTQHTTPIRVGIIGVGGAGDSHVKSYLKHASDATIVAVADINIARRQHIQDLYHIATGYADYHDMFDKETLDAVSIVTPNALHRQIALDAFARGYHVLCEKPLALSVQDAEEMADNARRANRVLHVAFTHRNRSDVNYVKQLVQDGTLGDIYYARASWLRRDTIPSGWFTDQALAGGGPLIDLGVHMLDMALYIMGEPEATAVSANIYDYLIRQRRPHSSVEDLGTAFIRLANGGTLLLETSWATYTETEDLYGVTIFGTRGGAEIRVKNYTTVDTLRVFTELGGQPVTLQPILSGAWGHDAAIARFITAIRSGVYEHEYGQDGIRCARIIDACYASAAQGREVQLTPVRVPAIIAYPEE